MSKARLTTVTLQPDGELSVTEQAADQDALALLQQQVGGYIELVQLTPTLCLYVDEDGMAKRREPNLPATLVAAAFGFQQGGIPLLGPAVFTGGVDRQGYDQPLTTTQVAQLRELVQALLWQESRAE